MGWFIVGQKMVGQKLLWGDQIKWAWAICLVFIFLWSRTFMSACQVEWRDFEPSIGFACVQLSLCVVSLPWKHVPTWNNCHPLLTKGVFVWRDFRVMKNLGEKSGERNFNGCLVGRGSGKKKWWVQVFFPWANQKFLSPKWGEN